VLPASVRAGDIAIWEFLEEEFPVSSWVQSEERDTGDNGMLLFIEQRSTGGNPGAFQAGSQDWGPGGVVYAHICATAGRDRLRARRPHDG
jgi:hypothetical protein